MGGHLEGTMRRRWWWQPAAAVERVAMPLAAVGTLAATLLVAFVHLDDRFRLNHVSGAWLSQAQSARDGVLVLPLFDGEHFGGTRYQPLPIALHWLIDVVVDDLLVSGKLLALAGVAAVLIATRSALRREGIASGLSWALPMLLLTSRPVFDAATNIRNDALPAAVQLAGLGLVHRTVPRDRLAGACFGIAWLLKTTALWGLAAAAIWLAARNERGRAARLLLVSASTVAVGVVVGQVASSGRYLDNMWELSGAGTDGIGSVVRGPGRVLDYFDRLERFDQALTLGAITLVVVALARRRSLTLHELAFVLSSVVTVALFADTGIDINHLLDAIVLALIVGAGAIQRAARSSARPVALAALLFLWMWSFDAVVRPPATATARVVAGDELAPELHRDLLADRLDDGPVLTDDTTIAVLNDVRPVVADAYMFARLAERHPEWAELIADRIDRGEFAAVILLNPVDGYLYPELHFGPVVMAAIERAYVREEGVSGRHVYVPRSG